MVMLSIHVSAEVQFGQNCTRWLILHTSLHNIAHLESLLTLSKSVTPCLFLSLWNKLQQMRLTGLGMGGQACSRALIPRGWKAGSWLVCTSVRNLWRALLLHAQVLL